MAPRPAPPPLGGRVRRVSLLIDIGGSSVEDYDRVRLLVRRLLSHFSRQMVTLSRWDAFTTDGAFYLNGVEVETQKLEIISPEEMHPIVITRLRKPWPSVT